MRKLDENAEKRLKKRKALVNKEYKRIRGELSAVPDDVLSLNDKLIWETASTAVNLIELNEEIFAFGMFYTCNGIRKANAALREIVKFKACYNNQMQILNKLKMSNQPDESDDADVLGYYE